MSILGTLQIRDFDKGVLEAFGGEIVDYVVDGTAPVVRGLIALGRFVPDAQDEGMHFVFHTLPHAEWRSAFCRLNALRRRRGLTISISW